jgi:hypothetical protein
MSVHAPRLCLVLLLLAVPGTSLANQTPEGPPASAYASKAGRAAYGIAMLSSGAAMLPITVESIIAGEMEPGQAPGFLVTAAMLGLGGIPILAEATKPLGQGRLAGARARVRIAREGVLAYAIFGSLFTSIGVIATAVKAAKTGDVPVDLRVFDVAAAWFLATSVGMTIDGEQARRQLPVAERSAPRLVDLGAPLFTYGLLLMTLVTPAMRLSFHDGGLDLEPTLLPMFTGIGMFAAGLTLLIADRACRKPIPTARRPATERSVRLGFAPIADPTTGTAGMALIGHF